VSEQERGDDARGARLAERMRWRATNDAALVAAMQKGNYEALREFYARFEPLLARFAARAGVSTDVWEEDAHDVLGDVVLALLEHHRPGRARSEVRDIHAYIQRAFRNRLLSATRGAARREQRDASAVSSAAETGERMVLSTCSESSVRASAAESDAARGHISHAIARLAHVIDVELSVSERQMLTWVSHDVPMREIASWLEISYAAAKVRLSRTRSRMRQRALRHVNECEGDERAELLDFFRRSAGAERSAHTSLENIVAGRQSRATEPGGAHADV
jgi:RNA polymerase sigma factor (sigma-70 family)